MKKLLIIILVMSFCGCTLLNDSYEAEKTAEQLVSEGSEAFMNKNFKNSIESFTTLKDWYPFSKYAILAELKIADAHYELKEYEEAIFAYSDFEKLHPRNEAVPYVIYRIGLCWYNRIDTIDRNQEPIIKSLNQFKRLIDQFPDSSFAINAKKNIEKCISQLASRELYIANFYLKSENYKAALKRFEYIISNFSDTVERQIALKKISICKEKINGLEKNK
ncbi:MAG: outer membrane protein assembly factor BamD [Desulfobacteraceae bacterium 4572_130]|nr:MAG: outer membrane protein assembly factor BamD [Desulfobacteraceae bacterium 4572_130]